MRLFQLRFDALQAGYYDYYATAFYIAKTAKTKAARSVPTVALVREDAPVKGTVDEEDGPAADGPGPPADGNGTVAMVVAGGVGAVTPPPTAAGVGVPTTNCAPAPVDVAPAGWVEKTT